MAPTRTKAQPLPPASAPIPAPAQRAAAAETKKATQQQAQNQKNNTNAANINNAGNKKYTGNNIMPYQVKGSTPGIIPYSNIRSPKVTGGIFGFVPTQSSKVNTTSTGSSGRTGSGGRNTGSPEKGRGVGGTTTTTNTVQPNRGPALIPSSNPPPTVTPSSTTTSEVSSAAAAAIPRQSLIPGRDVINFQTTPTSPEAMQQILFEEIAGYELVNMARRDTIEGQSDVYTVISNLSSIRREYNPVQLISLQKPNFTGFETYQVDLNNYVPGDGYLQERDLTSFYYIASNGDLIIELDNLQLDDEIEVQIANNGKIT